MRRYRFSGASGAFDDPFGPCRVGSVCHALDCNDCRGVTMTNLRQGGEQPLAGDPAASPSAALRSWRWRCWSCRAGSPPSPRQRRGRHRRPPASPSPSRPAHTARWSGRWCPWGRDPMARLSSVWSWPASASSLSGSAIPGRWHGGPMTVARPGPPRPSPRRPPLRRRGPMPCRSRWLRPGQRVVAAGMWETADHAVLGPVAWVSPDGRTWQAHRPFGARSQP